MKHIPNTRKLVSGVAMLALLLAGALVSQSSSQAAGLPTVRYVSPDFNAANETFASDGLGQYYAAGGRSFFKYVGAGSTITITYLITSDGTAPAADKAVSFMVNAPYSGSKAAWEVNGNAVGASSNSATGYGLLVAGKTDASGKISFTIKNTNTADSAMAIPASETQARALVGRLYGNMKLVIDGLNDMQQVVDLLTFDITKAPADEEKIAAEKAAADKAAADKAAADKAAADKAAADKAAADKAAADKAAADKAAADKAAADKAAADKAAADKAAADKAAAEKEAADKAAANMTQAEREAAEKAAADKAAADKAAADKAAADKAAADKAAADKAAADKAAADKAAADKAAADKLVKQKISSVSSSIKVGKTLTLPARSVSGLAIKWVSNTKSTCTISGTKLTGKKKGSCSITGKNAGNSKNAALAITKKLTVK